MLETDSPLAHNGLRDRVNSQGRRILTVRILEAMVECLSLNFTSRNEKRTIFLTVLWGEELVLFYGC